ncbi:MAG: PilC/PilY family type IV pilus protein [Acidobacteriota bacterium]|nr:PilC/PilY family type IV pilus protein [Acidobacteriota bacterium]
MKQTDSPLKGLLTAVAIVGATGALLLVTSRPGYTDDTDLVRKNSAKPYVMLILDTSGSMNLELATPNWLPLNGDDPRSRIYTAKRALYEVFQTQSQVNYGFMTFNQNNLKVQSKHWLYVAAEPASWPLGYPDYPKVPTQGGMDPREDAFTLGHHLGSDTLGACTAPLDLSNDVDRAKVNRFSKLDASGAATTTMWVTGADSSVYKLEVSPGSAGTVGDSTLELKLVASKVQTCLWWLVDITAEGPIFSESVEIEMSFNLVDEFLMVDANDVFVSATQSGGGNDIEDIAGFGDWTDALATAPCEGRSPFLGKGLEGNYDDPAFAPPGTPAAFPGDTSFLTNDDQYCSADGMVCKNLKQNTAIDSVYPEFRELDRGDFIPYHWDISAHTEVLKRLNPKHGTTEAADYGAASYFTNDSTATGTGYLALNNSSQRPLIAAGETPFGKAINDYRCWYLGPNIGPAGKCRESGDTIPFETGWQQLADGRDPDFECRRPYAILITDGEDTCEGESPTADVNDFDKFGVKTWIINLGGDAGEQRLNSILRTSKAEIITIEEGGGAAALGEELRNILGIIESESRAFAAAAVPSVQTEDESKIFLTSFNPLNDSSIWAGRSLAFLKPLPLRQELDVEGVLQDVPDTSNVCGATDTEECFLWDAGEVLKTQIKPADPIGSLEDQRRVVYPQAANGLDVPRLRQELEQSPDTGAGSPEEKDLWRGMGVSFIDGNVASEEDARTAANGVLDFTYRLKTGLLDPADASSTIDFILGDNFHAEPVVVAGPVSTQLFVQDFQGYREFAKKHQFRRKMLVVGANDGMLHFFDSGIPRRISSGGQVSVQYDRGTGKEVAAFVPRAALPILKTLSETVDHQWSVDGGLTVADIYMDPMHDGNPTAGDREWRTVVIAGMRRGGESVYALDITQPDPLKEVTITEPVPQTVLIPDVVDGASVPPCWNKTESGDNTCGADLRFAEPLWEFSDTVVVEGTRVRLDEDNGGVGNGEADFAQSWSKPNIGRIQLNVGGTIEDRFVAIFGGGIDPDKRDLRGNWLYVVDIETGQTIYKKQLDGSAPSEPAAVDTNQDGLLDRIYIATTKGYLYRVDLGPDGSGNLPELNSFALSVEVGGVLKSVPNQMRFDRTPTIVFDGIDSTTGTRLPFYFRPSVIFTPRLSPSFALAIGEGDRENLWSVAPRGGRFFVFSDDTDLFGGPITADVLEPLTPTSLNTSTSDFLFSPEGGKRHGWYITLAPNERVVADSFALSGITFFTTFTPDVESSVDPDNKKLRLCSRRGDSKAFAMLTNNGNGVLFDTNSNRTRSMDVNTLVSRAFADLAISKNDPSDPNVPPDQEPPPNELPANLQLIMDELKKLFPANCRFANYRIDIRAVAADTEVVDVAPVPVCLIEKNWREF